VSGPRLFGSTGKLIKYWGESLLHLQFQGQLFSWPFLLAAVDFPIMGVDFLKQHTLMVDPAKSKLVSEQGKFFATLLVHPSPLTASVNCFYHAYRQLVISSLFTCILSVYKISTLLLLAYNLSAYILSAFKLSTLVFVPVSLFW
jgi:hypothetical protein